MFSSHGLSIYLLVAGLLAVVCFQSAQRTRRIPTPPGPTGLPIIGNLLDMLKLKPWLAYRGWSLKYGKLLYMKVFGRSILVINDADVAFQLLGLRSNTYASRPRYVIPHLAGWGWHIAFLPYGKQWRDQRRVFWQHFRPNALAKYHRNEESGAHHLLRKLLVSPQNLTEHLRYSIGATLLRIMYALEVAEHDDSNMALAEKAHSSMERQDAIMFLLEYVPVLARVPRWVPGTGLLRRLDEARHALLKFRDGPWSYVKDSKLAGIERSCVARAMMEDISHLNDQSAIASETIARNAAGVAYSAGIDTQYATLQRFFLAMSLYTEVQKKAQAELDAVVGPTRLPVYEDRDALPYVNAIVKECLRWNAVLPLGVAHATLSEDIYEGYIIPKHTTVFVNALAILHDPSIYSQPEEFMPDRFLQGGKLNPDVKDPASIAFGFGRRICPGRYFADEMLFVFIASVLHTFNISPALDDRGRPIRIHPQLTSSEPTTYLEDCRCTIRPRSVQAEALVLGTAPPNERLRNDIM